MMKWICAAVLLSGSVVLANDIKNGGFEQEFAKGDWRSHWGSFSVEEWNDPPEGDWAGYIKGTWANAGNEGGVIQSQQGVPGVTYVLTAMFYTDGRWTADWQALKLEFFDKEDNLLHAQVDELWDLKDAQWVRKRVLSKAPDATARVQVVFEASGVGEGGVLGIDDVELSY